MLKIGQKQVAAIEEANLRAFAVDAARHLRRVIPDRLAGLDDGALRASLRRRLSQAISFGITDRFDALRYLESSYVLGWSDEGPDEEARAVLTRRGLRAAAKVDLIEQRTAEL